MMQAHFLLDMRGGVWYKKETAGGVLACVIRRFFCRKSRGLLRVWAFSSAEEGVWLHTALNFYK